MPKYPAFVFITDNDDKRISMETDKDNNFFISKNLL